MIKATVFCIVLMSTACFLQGASVDSGGLILKVSDEKSKPVAITKIQIWIKKEGGSQAFTFAAEPTGIPGIYRVPNLPAREYEGLKINKPNYAPGWVKNIVVTSGEMTELKAKEGAFGVRA